MAILTNPKDPNRPAAAHVLAPRSDLGTNAGLAVRVLAECVSDPNPEVAIGAAESLGGWLALEPEITVHALAGGLQDPRDKVRLACAKSLAGWGGRARPAVPALTLALHDSNSLVRGWALHALFEVGPDGLTLVMAVLANPKDPNRPVAAGLLSCRSCLGTNAGLAVRLLAECVSDPDPEVATEAADSLGRLALEPEITVPALAGGLEDPRDKVRIACARSLARIGGQARPAVPALTLALHESNFQVRNWATNIVLKIAPEVLDQMR